MGKSEDNTTASGQEVPAASEEPTAEPEEKGEVPVDEPTASPEEKGEAATSILKKVSGLGGDNVDKFKQRLRTLLSKNGKKFHHF